jgi:HTH-type transcriptional regulator, competence development regulator
MLSVGLRLRELRANASLSLRKAAILAGIDVAILSKMERGERHLNKALIIKLADLYKVNPYDLLVQFLGEKILYDLKDEQLAEEALQAAEKSIQYGKLHRPDLDEIQQKCRSVFQQEIRIEKVWIFGSYARRDQKPGSDLDVMIKIKGEAKFSLFDFAEIQFQLEDVLGLQVDIVEEDALNDFVQETVAVERILIYER